MTPKLKVLQVVFDGEIQPHELPAFRGAIAQKAGLKNILFHNHVGNKLRYRYPLIQYKCLHRHPSIICIGDGVEEIHHFFSKRDWSVNISGRTLDMKIDRLNMDQFTLQAWDQFFPYQIHNWIALNQRNYPEYLALKTEEERIQYLERKLTGNILSFATGINWYIDRQVKVKITELGPSRSVRFKGLHLRAFNVRFATNVFLPNHIGLGGKVSVGFGVVRKGRREEERSIIDNNNQASN